MWVPWISLVFLPGLRSQDGEESAGTGLPQYAVARLGAASLRHSDIITAIASSEGKTTTLASGSYDRTIRLWCASTGKERMRIDTPRRVASLSISRDGKVLATGAWDEAVIRLWNAENGVALLQLEGHTKGVLAIAFSADGHRLASGGMDQSIHTWEPATGKLVGTLLGHKGTVSSLAFTPDGKQIVSGSWDKTLRLWDVETGKQASCIEEPNTSGWQIGISRDGKTLFGAGRSCTIAWTLPALKEKFRVKKGVLSNLAVSWRGDRLAALETDREVHVRNAETGEEVAKFPMGTFSAALSFSPDGSQLAVGTGTRISLWNLATRTEISVNNGHAGRVTLMAISHGGKTIASTDDVSDAILLWDLEKGGCLKRLGGHQGDVKSLAFTQDDRTLISFGHDGVVRTWDAETGAERRLTALPNKTWLLSIAPQASIFAYGCDQSGQIQLWDAATGSRLRALEGPVVAAIPGVYSASGNAFASWNSDRTVRGWDVPSGKSLFRIRCVEDVPEITGVALSSDARLLALNGKRREVTLYWTPAAEKLKHLALPSEAPCIALSPDGKMLATGHRDGSIQLWETASGKLLRAFQSAAGATLCLSFSFDGRRLASGHSNTTVLVWDIFRCSPPGDAGGLWEALKGPDAAGAFQAALQLMAQGDEAVPLLSNRRLEKVADVDSIREWLRDLDGDEPAVRDRAQENLTGLNVESELKELLAADSSPELTSRVHLLLNASPRRALSQPEVLRCLRSILILEKIGTEIAAIALKGIARDTPWLHVRREAESALQRLGR